MFMFLETARVTHTVGASATLQERTSVKHRIIANFTCGLLLAAAVSDAAAQLPLLGTTPGEKPTLAPLIRQVGPAVVSGSSGQSSATGPPAAPRFGSFQPAMV